jgi:ABC-2 type transport system permease protein
VTTALTSRHPIDLDVLRAEWTKMRTVAGTAWMLVAIVVPTIALSVASTMAAACASAGCHQDPAKISLIGVTIGQAAVAIFAVMTVSGEYGSGMISVTFAAVPRRVTVLAAKALVAGGLVFLSAIVAVAGSAVVGVAVLPRKGFNAEHGYQLSLANGPFLRAASGSVLYLVLIGLLSIGVAVAVREAAVAIGVVLALLYLFPIVAAVVSDPQWHRRLVRSAPMTAGLAIQNTTDLDVQLIGPWPGLGVLAVWSFAALLLGGLLLRLRDA